MDKWERKSQEQAVLLDLFRFKLSWLQAADAVFLYDIPFFPIASNLNFNPWTHNLLLLCLFPQQVAFCPKIAPLLLSVYLLTIPPPSSPLSLSSQYFGRFPVAMKRPQQWPLSVRTHHCPRNACLIVACFNRGNTVSCLPAELFHRLILLLSLVIRRRLTQGHQ